VAIPADIKDSIIDLGCLPDDHVPLLLNSMNVMLAVSRPSSFGSYSYPVKIYEAMQCGVPVVATAVGGARWILGSRPESLVSYGDALMTAERVRDAMTREGRANAESHGWDSSASRLLSLLLDYRE
jgi:glycosyltransferase involved in cell wall biosynthesis